MTVFGRCRLLVAIALAICAMVQGLTQELSINPIRGRQTARIRPKFAHLPIPAITAEDRAPPRTRRRPNILGRNYDYSIEKETRIRSTSCDQPSCLFSSRDVLFHRRRGQRRGALFYRILATLSFSVALSTGRPAHATSGGMAVSHLIPSMIKLLRTVTIRPTKKWIRPIVWSVALCLLASALVQEYQVKQRQSIDATSEWGRYAANPVARGWAVMALSGRILNYWILTRLAWRDKWKTELRERAGKRFSDGLLRLGPLYIKLGQIVSCRENLLPDEWIAALEQLQDRVPAKSGQDALELAYASVGSRERLEELFSSFDTQPLAAASLGQVHRAVLRSSNETVAVKLQRPYLRSIYDQDLKLLLKIASVMDKFAGKRAQVGGVAQSWTDIFTDAKEVLYREIDYRDEADNAIRFAEDFGLGKGGSAITPRTKSRDNITLPSAAPWLRTPYVYRDLTSEKFLVMEFVPSIKITDKEGLDAANITAVEEEYLADCLSRAYLRQFTVNMFFSTDPHPGNLGVERTPNTHEPRLIIYDFGQACELKPDQADGILEVIEAIVDMDADKSVKAFDRMGVLTEDADIEVVRAKVQSNFDSGKVKVKHKKLKKEGYKFKDPPETTFASNTTAPKDSDVMSFFTLPAEYAFVARALSQMHGVGKTLDPDFDFVSSAASEIIEVKGVGRYFQDEWKKWIGGVETKFVDWQKSKFSHLVDD